MKVDDMLSLQNEARIQELEEECIALKRWAFEAWNNTMKIHAAGVPRIDLDDRVKMYQGEPPKTIAEMDRYSWKPSQKIVERDALLETYEAWMRAACEAMKFTIDEMELDEDNDYYGVAMEGLNDVFFRCPLTFEKKRKVYSENQST